MAPLMEIPKRVNAKQLLSLKLSDFQASAPADGTSPNQVQNALSGSAQTASQLRTDRERFAKGIPIGGNRLCYPTDRGAALAVYQEALKRITSSNHIQIQSETNLKVHTILGLRQADPDDAVFMSGGMVLSPLEPQYAEPRLDFLDDQLQHKAAWRLKAWRKEGWPEVYPAKAIELETTPQGKLIKGKPGNVDLLKRMRKWDKADWGDEVHANSGSSSEG